MINLLKNDKGAIRSKIWDNLQKVDAERSIIWLVIHGAIKRKLNFEQLLDTIMSQYYDSNVGMISIVGEETMKLILKYNSLP